MSYEEERRQILKMIEDGVISAEKGVQLLNALVESKGPAVPETPEAEAAPSLFPPDPILEKPTANSTTAVPKVNRLLPYTARFRRWWIFLLWIGIGIVVFSALLMYLAYRSNGFGFWFACTWFPFLLGVVTLALAAIARTARWLYIRIRQKPGQLPPNITISIPLPLRLSAWFVKTFRHRLRGLDGLPNNVEGLLYALQKATPKETLYVRVDEGENGEQVEVYIG